MKWVVNVLAVVFMLVGLVWILQGVNLLAGSPMTGHVQYAYLGLGLGVVGAGLLAWNNRRPRPGAKM